MKKIQCVSMVALTLISGFIGGILSNKLFVDKMAFAQNEQKTVTAESFNLVDKNGELKANLSTNKNGEPMLSFIHERKPIIILSIGDGKPSLILINKKNTAFLGAWDNGSYLKLSGEDSDVNLIADPEGSGLMITDQSSQNKIRLILLEKDPQLFINRDNCGHAMLSIDDEGPRMSFGDKTPSEKIILVTNNEDKGSCIKINGKTEDDGILLAVSETEDGYNKIIKSGNDDFNFSIVGGKYDHHLVIMKEGEPIWGVPYN